MGQRGFDGQAVKCGTLPRGTWVPCMSLIPYLDAKERLTSLLFALDCDATHIKFLPEKFKLIVASLRFLVSNAQPKLEVNHLVAILCCCVNLEGERKENAVNRKRFSQPFDVRAAQSFSQWQCVLREAINLNFVLLEPVATPCIHKDVQWKTGA
ncbi:Protein asteroid 1 [Desmophyllum pertusum]|uniref:Protein asteroid 1 n=1 Tax=Desmophyllum pertusum TaxID=174260 RepID=A0A9W9YQB1_9CNID|nr:Protein asteroid 1 [Desmophyllum pertusum]